MLFLIQATQRRSLLNNLDKFNAQHEAGILYNNGFPAYLEIEGLTLKT